MNQVELLGLAGSLATGNLATFCGKHAQKKYGYSNGDEYILLLFYVIISDLAISLVFHRFGGISPKKFDCSPDRFSPGGARGVGRRLANNTRVKREYKSVVLLFTIDKLMSGSSFEGNAF